MDSKTDFIKQLTFTQGRLQALEQKGLEAMSDAQVQTLLGALTKMREMVLAVLQARKER